MNKDKLTAFGVKAVCNVLEYWCGRLIRNGIMFKVNRDGTIDCDTLEFSTKVEIIGAKVYVSIVEEGKVVLRCDVLGSYKNKAIKYINSRVEKFINKLKITDEWTELTK